MAALKVRVLKLVAFSFVAGCATPYQQMGFSGGYSDKPLGTNRYLVTVQVNGYTDRSTALEYLNRRAGELCPTGYDIVDRAGGDNGGVVVTRSFISENHKPEEDAVIQCKVPPQPVAQTEEEVPTPKPQVSSPKRRVVYGQQSLYCAPLTADSNAGPCFLDQSRCEETHSADGTTYGACEERKAGACFNAVRALDDSKTTFCSVSVSSCEAVRVTHSQDPDFQSVGTMCGVYRVGVEPGADSGP